MAREQLVQILQDHGVRAYTRGGAIYALDQIHHSELSEIFSDTNEEPCA